MRYTLQLTPVAVFECCTRWQVVRSDCSRTFVDSTSVCSIEVAFLIPFFRRGFTDRAEQRADDIECERTALEAQVEALTIALRRSRDAIEAIRLCDTEAEASSWVAPGDSTAFDSRGNPISAFPAAVDRVPKSVETISGGTALRTKRVGGSTSPPPSCESWHGRPSGPMSSTEEGALERWSFDGGRDWDSAAAVALDEEDKRRVLSSLGGTALVDYCARYMEHKRRQQKRESSLSCRGERIGEATAAAAGHAVGVRVGWGRGPRGRRPRRGDDKARISCSEPGYGSSLSMSIGDCGRPSRSCLCDEEEEISREISRGCCRKSDAVSGKWRQGGGGDMLGGGSKRENAAESLLEAETERMARELEEKRASFWEQEAVREEDTRREREVWGLLYT